MDKIVVEVVVCTMAPVTVSEVLVLLVLVAYSCDNSGDGSSNSSDNYNSGDGSGDGGRQAVITHTSQMIAAVVEIRFIGRSETHTDCYAYRLKLKTTKLAMLEMAVWMKHPNLSTWMIHSTQNNAPIFNQQCLT